MNDRADAEAKSVLQDFVGRSNAYSLLVDAYKAREYDAKKLASLHASIAFRSVAVIAGSPAVDRCSLSGEAFTLDHPALLVWPVNSVFCHEGYLARLRDFFEEVQWSPSSGGQLLSDPSWVELFVLSTRDVGVLPPIWTGVRWALFGEDDVATVCNIEFVSLYRIWKRAIVAIGVRDLFSDRLVTRCSSCVELGFAFRPSGVAGRFAHSDASSSEVEFLASGASSLGSVRVPFLEF